MRLALFAWLFSYAQLSADDRCPAWTKDPEVMKTIGACPKPGEGRLLHSGDSFPELAMIVSEDVAETGVGYPSPSPRYKLGKKNPSQEEAALAEDVTTARRLFIGDTVVAALKRAGTRPPMIFLPVGDRAFNEVVARVLFSAPPAERDRWLRALVQVKDIPGKGQIPASPWQQDYFKSLINEKGQAELRHLEYYGRGTDKIAGPLFDKMAEACPLLKRGPDIQEPPKSARKGEWQSAYYGGNIQGGPLGTCLLGDNQDPEFGKQFCPDVSKHIRLPVGWLTVGHVDEVVNIVPRPAGKAPCDFAILISSPNVAIKALKSAPNEKFFDFYFGLGNEAKKAPNAPETENRLSSSPVKYLCDAIFAHPEENPLEDLPKKEKEHSWLWIREARAAEPESAESLRERCRNLTNRQVLGFLAKNQEFALTQELVEKKMEETRKIFREKLAACSVEFREVPDLFFGGHLVQKKNFDPIDPKVPLAEQFELPNGEILSLLPNATNSEVVGKAILALILKMPLS